MGQGGESKLALGREPRARSGQRLVQAAVPRPFKGLFEAWRFVLAPATPQLFPRSVRNRYRDWSSLVDEAQQHAEDLSVLCEMMSMISWNRCFL